MPGYWKMALAYRSTRYPNSYYLAFEDWEGADDDVWQGNDGDFNDKVFRDHGVICDGGGEPCDTEMPGVCAQGVTECQVGAGDHLQARRRSRRPRSATTWTTTATASSTTATASARPTSSAARACASGPATTASSRAPIGLRCDTDGLCKDPRCATVDCPAGQVCQAGTCVGGCPGVTCPLGQVCQLGVCVDPCAGVSCPGAVCEMGACVSACRCRACDTGQVCVMGGALDGHCVDTGCEHDDLPDRHHLPPGLVRRRLPGGGLSGRCAMPNGMCDPPPTRHRRERAGWAAAAPAFRHHRPRGRPAAVAAVGRRAAAPRAAAAAPPWTRA